MMLHPSTHALCRYADGAQSPRQRERIRRHLMRCSRCRSELIAIRRQDEALRSLHPPSAPLAVLERVHAARAAGQHALLFTAAGPPAHNAVTHWRRIAASACALIIITGAVALFVSSELSAYSNELRFSTDRPIAGATVQVEYRPDVALAGEQVLRLRARYRTRHGVSYNWNPWMVDAARLQKGADGVYRGAFTLPDSVVYATFAVEDTLAHAVDTNARRGWELLVHGSDRRPLATALLQRMDDHMGRSWEEAYATARRMAELYPDVPASWRKLHWYEAQLRLATDSIAERQERKLRELHAQFSPLAEVRPEDAEALMYLAKGQRDEERERYWAERLIAIAPASHGAIHYQTDRIFHAVAARELSYGDALLRLEALHSVAPRHEAPISAARVLLQPADSPVAVLRWVDRWWALNPNTDGAEALLAYPQLRAEGIARLQARIAALSDTAFADRGLFSSRNDHLRARVEPALAWAHARLGSALLADGDTAGAAAAAARAAGASWEPRRFREAAATLFAAGDTAGAAALWAKAAVDPGAPAAFPDSVANRIGNRFATTWPSLVEDARTAMRLETMKYAVSRALPEQIMIADAAGASVRLRDIMAGQPAVVVLWSRYCGPALAALPQLAALEARLAADGVRLITIVEEVASPAFREFIAAQPQAPVMWHDQQRQAKTAFSSFGTPEYFIVDANGRVRFQFTNLADIPRQVGVLESLTRR